jgi:hypothetical protein
MENEVITLAFELTQSRKEFIVSFDQRIASDLLTKKEEN